MAQKKKKSDNESTPDMNPELEEKIATYDKILDRLKNERQQVERELKDEYRNARRYVRSHPEEGVLLSFVGGVMLGVLIGKLTK
ncbi:MAG: hypothetical protein R3222_00365 [Balneolaceae bacterium]|nr:hypothetical protein [Balneolaceae bacterium]